LILRGYFQKLLGEHERVRKRGPIINTVNAAKEGERKNWDPPKSGTSEERYWEEKKEGDDEAWIFNLGKEKVKFCG